MSQKYQIFAVYDKKAVAYLLPIYYPQKGMAIRVFEDSVNDPQAGFQNHPEDFCLFHLGSYDNATGMIEPLPNPVPVEEALNVIKNPK